MMKAEYPAARRDELVIQEPENEVLIYDLRSNKASCLNSTAAMVWNQCDGTKSVDDISRAVSAEAKTEVSADMVELAVLQLSKNHLLKKKYNVGSEGLSRRELIRKIGLSSAVALPLVLSMVAPTAAHANSSCITGGTCTCDGAFPPMAGQVCPTSMACADTNCLCTWENNGNAMGTCVP